MRNVLRASIPSLKWPVQAGVFVTHFLHHALAFFVWAALILHVAVPAVGAGFNIRQISQEFHRFLDHGTISWRGVIAVALVPAVIVALRQAYLSWEELRERLAERGFAPDSSVHALKWPVRTCRFLATFLQQTAGFVGWSWILFALVGSLGEAGSHWVNLRETGIRYLKDVGSADWAYLIAVASIPALLVALWNAKRAYRRLHATTQDHVLAVARDLRPAS